MRVLVTGGAGFVGTHLCRRLLAEGHSVTALDILRHGDAHERIVHPAYYLVEGDARDDDDVNYCCTDRTDAIVHLASWAGVRDVIAHPERTIDICVTGARRVLDAATDWAVRKVILFSSSEVYGANADPALESMPTPIGAPESLRWGYAAGKLAAEHLARAYYLKEGLNTTSVRLFNTYGPGQLGQGAVANFCRAVAAGRPISVYGAGTARRTWCYVSDVVDAVMRMLARPDMLAGEVVNIGNPTATASLTVEQLANVVASFAGDADVEHLWDGDVVLSASEVYCRVPDISRARAALDWEPRVGLDEGIARTLAYYREAARGE